MEFLISNKRLDKKFIFVKARRCGSNSLNHWLNDNIVTLWIDHSEDIHLHSDSWGGNL